MFGTDLRGATAAFNHLGHTLSPFPLIGKHQHALGRPRRRKSPIDRVRRRLCGRKSSLKTMKAEAWLARFASRRMKRMIAAKKMANAGKAPRFPMTFRYSQDRGTAGGLRKHLKSQKKNVSTTNPNRMKFLVGSMLQAIIAKSFRIRCTCRKSTETNFRRPGRRLLVAV